MKVNDPSIFSDASVMATVIREASEELTYNDSYVVLAEYYDVVEQAILDSGIAYLPAKSSEFKHKEKPLTDQPMISHLRNGVHAIVESNRTLHMMRKDSALNNDELKKVIALYVAHELHKLNPRQNKDQFDISEDEALKWIIQFNLLSFAPSLTSLDYQSVATSNHSKIGFHTNLSKEYILYKPWIQLADALSSITTPKTTDHLQSLLNKIDCDLKFAYHTLNSSTGITTNIINSAIIDWASKEGLIPLLIFESGILYITDNKNEHKLTNKQDIEDIYNHFKK